MYLTDKLMFYRIGFITTTSFADIGRKCGFILNKIDITDLVLLF